jgi:hypothetical protein
VALGNTKYHHQDGGIPNIRFKFFLFDHGSRTDERDQSFLYKFYRQSGHKLHYFKVAITEKWHYETQNIITRMVAFQTYDLSWFSLIMVPGQMKCQYILYIFQTVCP